MPEAFRHALDDAVDWEWVRVGWRCEGHPNNAIDTGPHYYDGSCPPGPFCKGDWVYQLVRPSAHIDGLGRV